MLAGLKILAYQPRWTHKAPQERRLPVFCLRIEEDVIIRTERSLEPGRQQRGHQLDGLLLWRRKIDAVGRIAPLWSTRLEIAGFTVCGLAGGASMT